MELQLGYCQAYKGLEYHSEEAYAEMNMDISKASWRPAIAIFSKKYYNEIRALSNEKKYDYCFIGSIKSCKFRRQWIIDFMKKYFTEKSIFVNTDNDKDWVPLGVYDKSNSINGYCPKQQKNNQSRSVQYRIVNENLFYFETMRQSKFCLCPAGDSLWSFRFYEVLMCESIPIVQSWHHTYRTEEESKINYSYYLSCDYSNHIYNTSLLKNNTEIFEKYHLLH